MFEQDDKQRQDFKLRQQELELKRRELELKEQELRLKMRKDERISNAVSTSGSILLLFLKWAIVLGVPLVICSMSVPLMENVLNIGSDMVIIITFCILCIVVGIPLANFLKKKLIG